MALIQPDETTAEEEDLTPAALTTYGATTGSRGGPFIHHARGLDRPTFAADETFDVLQWIPRAGGH